MSEPRQLAGAVARFVVAVLGLATLSLPAAAQIAPDAPAETGAPARGLQELVDRYLDWRGPAFGQLETIHERFYVNTAAGRLSGGLWIDRSGRMRRETSAAGVRQVEVAAPDGSWRTDGSGRAEDDPGAFERTRRYALLEFGEALTGRGGASVTLGADTEVMDKTWRVLRVSFGDADAYEALVDPISGQLCCYRITEAGRTRLELFGDWRLVDGVRMPFARLTQAGGETEMIVGAVELNRPLQADLFRRPTTAG